MAALVVPKGSRYLAAMNVYTMMVAVVVVVFTSEVIKAWIKGRASAPNNEVDAALREEVAQLRTEVAALQNKLEVQETLVDEAVSQFRPRVDQLRAQSTETE